LTRQSAELAGALVFAGEGPATEFTVVVFSAESAYWTATSRRIRAGRPASDGSFSFPDLPPGDYLMAAVSMIEDGQWLDPAFLAALSKSAVKVRVPDAGRVIQALEIAR
jgi:hypothetical protein